jgi:enoyl-CoA hydratase/carnithine racemase
VSINGVLGNGPTRAGEVIVTVDGAVVTATIDRPEKRNAINYGVIDGLMAAITTTIDRGASVLVVRGAGPSFCAGADLNLVRSTLDDENGLNEFLARLSSVCDAMAAGPFVSLAVITGYAVAGGCEILLACDLAVASHDAKIGDRHLHNSLLPGAGGSTRMFQALTPARARRLFYTAEMISGRLAEEWGLVSEACAPDQLEATVARLISQLEAKSPAALRAMKRMTLAAESLPMADALVEERRIFLDYATGSSHVRDALTAFLNVPGPVSPQPRSSS